MIKIKAPKLTVLMSVFNNENTVRRAVKSILEQSLKDFEFLIIDDSSTDNSLTMIRSFEDRRVRVISNKDNIGLTRSLNKGLKLSSGKYIARLDADDISLPQRLEKQIDFLENNPDFVLCATSYNIINKNGNIGREIKYYTDPEKIYYDLNFQNIIAHSSAMYRKKEVLSIGGYNGEYKYAQDYDLWIRLSIIGKIWILPDILTNWCDDLDNISSRNQNQQSNAALNIFENNLKKIGIKQKHIDNIKCFHNLYNQNYLNCSPHEIKNGLDSLYEINLKLVDKAPEFYDKKAIERVSYKTRIDLITNVFKKTSLKGMVLKHIIKNLFDLKMDHEIIRKIIKI